MTTSTGGRLRGLEELWGLREVLKESGPGAGLPLPLVEGLRRVIRCDRISFADMDSAHRRHPFMQVADADGSGEYVGVEDDDAEGRRFWQLYWTSPSSSYPDRTGDRASVVLRSDFLSDRQWLEHPMFRDCLGPSARYTVLLALPGSGPGRTLRLIGFRESGHDFTEQERFLLELLRPHLAAAYRRSQAQRVWDKMAALTGTPPARRLTPRQRQVLALVRDGATNAAIARRLGIAEGTVRKHLEHIHATLGVSSRTAAAVAAEDLV